MRFARSRRGACVVGLIALLMGSVAFWIVVAVHQLPTDRGCIGMLERCFRTRKNAEEGLVVSASLLAAAVVAGVVAFPPRSIGPRRRFRAAHPASPGFTLIETLLAVLIIALLFALLVPSMGSFRETARGAKSMTNLRSHVAIFANYTSDWRDAYPYFTYPQATRTVLRAEQAGVAVEVP